MQFRHLTMNKLQEQVTEFHRLAGQVINDKPCIPDTETIWFRLCLIQEELTELTEAFVQEDVVEVADALADLMWVIMGTAVSCGINMEPVLEEVRRSNMTKFIDGYRDENGKWRKGPSFEEPNIKAIIEEQSK